MAIDKAVDSAALEAALKASADAIREKTGDSASIPWDAAKGFAEAIAGIKAGGDIGGKRFEYCTYTVAEDKTSAFDVPLENSFNTDAGYSMVFYWSTPHNTAPSSDPAKVNFGCTGVQIIKSDGTVTKGTIHAAVNKYGSISSAYNAVYVFNGRQIAFSANTSLVVPAGLTLHFLVISNDNAGVA